MFDEMKTRYFLVLTLLLMIIFGMIAIFVPYSESFADIGLLALLYIAAPVIFFRYYFRKQRRSVREVVFTKGSIRWLPWLLGVVVLSLAFSMSSFWLQLFVLYPTFPWLVEFFLEPVPMPENPLYFTLTILSISIIAPVAEEFIFRGVLLKRMIKKTSVWGGILISSIIFGILHPDIFGALVFGIVTSLLYLKTNNLFIPILFHIINNSIVVLLMYIAPSWPQWGIITSSELYAKALPNMIVLVISSTFMTWVIVRLAKGLRSTINEEEIREIRY